ncbi:MAG: TraB/GumN family protein [Pseudomonadota bacterium]
MSDLNPLHRALGRSALAGLIWVATTVGAVAACAGVNLIPELRASDVVGVDAMFDKAHAVPNSQGRLWRVDREGVDPSYLLGTFHSGEAIATVTPKIWSLLEAARSSVFEVSLDQQTALEARMATDPSFAFDLEGPGAMAQMTEEQREAFRDALDRRGVDLQAADRMRPWLLAALLAFPPCHLEAMSNGDQPMDDALARRAQARGIPVIGLESYDVALESLNRVPRETMMVALVGAPEMLDRDEDVYRTNSILYEQGNIQAITELGIYLTERVRPDLDAREINGAMMTELLDVRNRNWMPALERELSAGGAFVAVGALHLPGEVGLIELLRARGFSVSRVPVQ